MPHFELLATSITQHRHQSLAQMMHAAAEHKLEPLLKALQYATLQTANSPLTQGYKVCLRQLGIRDQRLRRTLANLLDL